MEARLERLGTLTTQHLASRDGQPVLLLEGEQGGRALGPEDMMDVAGAEVPAAIMVRGWLVARGEELTEEERALARTFVGKP